MKRLLPLFKNPSHYLGSEFNSVHKHPDSVNLRWVLVFPDLYPVGMSYLGLQVLYHLLNSSSEIWAERCFAPHPEVGRLLKKYKLPLCSLESDTPINEFDVVGFSLTHELSYTTALYVMDLAHIPFCSEDRNDPFPLIIAGGEAMFNPEPVSSFFDLIFIGEAEEAILEIADKVLEAKSFKLPKYELLKELSKIKGVHVPLFKGENNYFIERRVVNDLDQVSFPEKPIIPFGKPVHDRFTVEIAKGCTRGCRFCLAGMTSRPVRERSLDNIKKILVQGINQTGYEEVSFLSLSSGDFSAIDELLSFTFEFCKRKNISISLPSLRIDSFNDPSFLRYIADIRKTGITLAPEAGTQKLRNIINKTITHDEIIGFAKLLNRLGWQNLKLYFMIGLPFEKDEDLKGIFELSLDVYKAFARSKRSSITVSVAGFVPKPHTPFQWVAQCDFNELKEKISFLRSLFKPYKRINFKWHDPKMSFIEGVFSRGDHKLSCLLVEAYRSGDILTSWDEFFDFNIWLEAFDACGVDPYGYTGSRSTEQPLPWDYVCTGVNKKFLLDEFKRAQKQEVTPDCRSSTCLGCGVCDIKNKNDARLKPHSKSPSVLFELNSSKISTSDDLTSKNKCESKRFFYRIWFEKLGPARFLSQIELQKNLERIFRRAEIPMCFSKGFHPKPIISFGRALSVGIESLCEWLVLCSYKKIDSLFISALNRYSIPGIKFFLIEELPKKKVGFSVSEKFLIRFKENSAYYIDKIKEFFLNRKNPFLKAVHHLDASTLEFVFCWEKGYKSPVALIKEAAPEIKENEFVFQKIVQCIE